MAYKVFLVEDEIVTREGIRDNVDWAANGFEFCGEAPDGEVALPLLQATQPEVLITDIKMPFMDGLQLCQIVRERWPAIKIVILSGHDEFEYARRAIQVGVSDYLLKPITVRDLHALLQKVAAQLAQERAAQAQLCRLRAQVDENRAALQERLLLKLVVGAVSAAEAIEQGQGLGLDLMARCYLVVILKAERTDCAEPFDYAGYQQVQQRVAGVVENNPDVFFLKKDWEAPVLLMKGQTPECLEEERDLLEERMQRELGSTGYRLSLGSGTPKTRIADICQSFMEALVNVQPAAAAPEVEGAGGVDKTELLKLDKGAVENYLRCGRQEEFDRFFDAFIRPLGATALRAALVKNYILVDVAVAAAKVMHELGGEVDQVVPELASLETILANIKTVEQLREQVRQILFGGLAFRDRQANRQHAALVHQAQAYMGRRYTDPELSLNEVAAQVNLSASHFSLVFGQETRQSFKEYLTDLRLNRAKALLRTTGLRAAEIAYQVGYSDPHYFSYVFKKKTGLSPIEFRLQSQPDGPAGGALER